jgi:pimeloyl-ACP methyl ester carboxylesterase
MMAAPDSLVPVLCRERNRIVFRFYLNNVAALDRMRVGYCDWSAAALRHELTAGGLVFASLSGYDFLPDLAKMTQPALVVEGTETRVPLDATRAWATALPNGRLLLFPGASHMIWLEGDIPAAKRALRQFLDGEWPEGAEKLHP